MNWCLVWAVFDFLGLEMLHQIQASRLLSTRKLLAVLMCVIFSGQLVFAFVPVNIPAELVWVLEHMEVLTELLFSVEGFFFKNKVNQTNQTK